MRWGAMRRALVGSVVVVGVLGAMAVPASATTGTLVSGDLRIHTVPPTDFPVPGTAPDPCKPPLPDQDLDIDFSGDGISGTWTIPEQSVKSRFVWVGFWVQLDLQILESTGTYTWDSPVYSLASQGPDHVEIIARFHLLDPPDCTKKNLVCSLQARVVVVPVSFVASLNMPNPLPGDSALLNATSGVPGGSALGLVPGEGCTPPFTTFIGLHATLANIVIAF